MPDTEHPEQTDRPERSGKGERRHYYPAEPPRPRRYVLLYKPYDVLSEFGDASGKQTLGDYVPLLDLEPAGRLDQDSEGLLILTNDGELANRLTHPKYGIAKTYLVEVEGRVTPRVGDALIHGVDLDDGLARLDRYRVVDSTPQASLVEVILHEGRNRIVRRMLDKVGHPVLELVRTQFGPVRLGTMAPGEVRELTPTEVGRLMDAAGM